MYILVKEYLGRIERIKNGTASISDIERTNVEFQVFGRLLTNGNFDTEKIKIPDLVFEQSPMRIAGKNE